MLSRVSHSVTHNRMFVRLTAGFICLTFLIAIGVTPALADVNIEPTLDPIDNQTILEDSGSTIVQLTGISSGIGDVDQTLTINASSSDPSILPDPDISYTSPDTSGSLSLTPSHNMFGGVDITVTVQDDGGTADGGDDSVSRMFHVTITAVNDPPVVSSFTKNGIRGEALAFTDQDFLDRYSDVELDPMTGIKVVSLPTAGQLTVDGIAISAGTEIATSQLDKLAFMPVWSWYGSTSFSWTATDGQDYATPPASVTINYAYTPILLYLPFIIGPVPNPPIAFLKTAPSNGAEAQPINPVLDWQESSGADDFQYCIDANINNSCDGSWVSAGAASQVQVTGLSYSTKYEWHVRAKNQGGITYSNGSPSAFSTFTTAAPPAWANPFTENFEGVFPGDWELSSALYYDGLWYDVTDQVAWGKRTCKRASGSYGGWAVGGGAYGQTVPCNGSYPDNYEGWMVYGPIDLSQAKDGYISMKIWSDTAYPDDEIGWGLSLDNNHFYGWGYSGDSSGWISDTIDLKNVYTLGNVLGSSQVWIGIWFTSYSANTGDEKGVAVDDIVLSTCNTASGCSGNPTTSTLSVLPDNLLIKPSALSHPDTHLGPATMQPSSDFFNLFLSWLLHGFHP